MGGKCSVCDCLVMGRCLRTPQPCTKIKSPNKVTKSHRKFAFSIARSNCDASSVTESSSTSNNKSIEFEDLADSLLRTIWHEVDSFNSTLPADTTDNEYSDDENCDLFDPRHRCQPVMGRMPCGGLHVCRPGRACPFLEPNEDRVMVCMYTGVEHGPEQTDEFFDLNGGTGKKSGDPDQSCGDTLHGRYTKRCDPVQASRMAFELSNRIEDDDKFEYYPVNAEPKMAKRVHKRGALCVGEEVIGQPSKKSRFNKKNVQNKDTVSNLQAEAERVVSKMIDHRRTATYKQKARVGTKPGPIDTRLCDEKFVFKKSVQRYIKKCLVEDTTPNMDVVHNLALMAQTVSAKARKQLDNSNTVDALRTAKFRTLCSSLIVSLWSAACSTPYMDNAKRGTDAYRPFICGILYGFKRGIKLDNGTVIVPQFPQLSDALPMLRGTGGNTQAKTLHSSSHRGLCTLTRCIASVPRNKQDDVFSNVSRLADKFARQTFLNTDI